MYLLVGPILLISIVKPRAVVVTEKSIVTVQPSRMRPSKVAAVVSRHDHGAVPVALPGLGLKIGDDDKVFAFVGTFRAMKEAARLAQQPEAAL
jgi:hypothetical protein